VPERGELCGIHASSILYPLTPALMLSAQNLTKDYGPHRILDNVSLTLHRGETLGLVGESGSGKSTLARLLLRLIEPTSGQILYAPSASTTPINLLTLPAKDMRRLRRHMSIVFQDPYAALNPRMSVRQILSEPFIIHHEIPTRGTGSKKAALTERLHELLAEVHLDPSALTRYPHEFSGGQRQRINIARALALRPELLVLDEPVSALDVSVAAQIINLLRDLQQRHHLTCLFISHSMPLVRYLCHQVAVMQRGHIVETGPAQQVCDHPTNPYTQQLLSATPELPTLT
jgi:peptide/nickel transport system ATP-binding protein